MDPIIGASLVSAVGNLVGGLFGSSSAKKQNKAADQQAQREMDFQERMSSTAHQREVKDLRAAGLNPVLSANAGASSPSGAMAPVTNTAEPLRDSITHSARGVTEALLNKQNIKTLQSVERLNIENAKKAAAETTLISGGKLGLPGGTSVPLTSVVSGAKSLFSNIPERLDRVRNNFWRETGFPHLTVRRKKRG